MKTTSLLALVIVLCLTGQSLAQEQDDHHDRKKRSGTHNHFNVDLGFNNYLENGESPDTDNAPYAVKPWGSWYLALKTTNVTHVGGPLRLLWGADVSWYTFKFQNEGIRISETPDGVVFNEFTGEIDPVKSKLTVAYLNASLVPMFQFGESTTTHRHHWHEWNESEGFRIGLGGYAGYKIASFAKYVAKEDGDREKDKDRDGFYLNNFRYGIKLQMGFRNLDLFFNYDLNSLFASGKGPDLNAFSFGVTL